MTKPTRILAKVYANSSNNQKLINIPKGCNIMVGDWVELLLVPDQIMGKED